MSRIPALWRHLCDDAAIFPPGNAPLADAVRAHDQYVRGEGGALVGPFVVGAAKLVELPPLLSGHAADTFEVSVTVPTPDGVPAVVSTCAFLPPVRLRALEVAVPAGMAAAEVVPALDAALAGVDVAGGAVDVYVEVPRDGRRADLLAALADSPYRAKFRTGGVAAELYPDEAELAAAVHACVAAGLPFKATAGLHHAVRNTDPSTGFEQHGFVNLLLAADVAGRGGSVDDVAAVLADRDGAALAARLRALPEERVAALRAAFTSFGTCSIAEPRDELAALGLLADPSEQETP